MGRLSSDENTSKKLFIKMFADIVCLLLVGIPILIFYLVGQPYKRGFFCNDQSLMYPYHESTVPSWVLYVFGLGLPIVVMIFTELALFRYSSKEKIVILNRHVPSWVWDCYHNTTVFGFGAVCSQLITDIAKYSIGRLRPHFINVCQPTITCNSNNENLYLEEYQCRGTQEDLLKDMRLSFPSGHASFSTYCMVFLVGYLQSKICWKQARLFKHVLQFIAISLALYTSLSRVSDYKHHWSDVLAGAAQGALVAILIVRYVSDLFPPKKKKRMDIPSDQDVSDSGLKMDERDRYNNTS